MSFQNGINNIGPIISKINKTWRRLSRLHEELNKCIASWTQNGLTKHKGQNFCYQY